MNTKDKNSSDTNKKPKKSGFGINVGSLGDVATDTVDGLKHAVTSIGQEMLHQITPGMISKPGDFQPKSRASESEEKKEDIDGRNQISKDELRRKDVEKKRIEEEKYKTMPLSSVTSRKGSKNVLGPKSLSQNIDLDTGRKGIDLEKYKKINSTKQKVEMRMSSTAKDQMEEKQRGLIRSVAVRYFQLIIFILKPIIFIFRKIIQLVTGILTFILKIFSMKRKKEGDAQVKDTIFEEYKQENIDGVTVVDESEINKNEDIGKEAEEDLKLTDEREMYNKEGVEKSGKEGIIYDSTTSVPGEDQKDK